jgi:hypothetical protein
MRGHHPLTLQGHGCLRLLVGQPTLTLWVWVSLCDDIAVRSDNEGRAIDGSPTERSVSYMAGTCVIPPPESCTMSSNLLSRALARLPHRPSLTT